MDCSLAKEWIVTALLGSGEPSESVRTHLAKCSSCQSELDACQRTWAQLGTWADKEPPARLDRAILAAVTERAQTKPSWLSRFAKRRVWATAAAALVLAVIASFLFPYEKALRLCGKVFAGAGLAPQALPISFLVGALYTFLPLVMAVVPWVCLNRTRDSLEGMTVGQAFAVIMVPYVLVTCIGLEATVITGLVLGTVTGALLGGAVSQWVIRHRPTGVTA